MIRDGHSRFRTASGAEEAILLTVLTAARVKARAAVECPRPHTNTVLCA